MWLGVALLLFPIRLAGAQTSADDHGADIPVILNSGSASQLSTEGYYTLSWSADLPGDVTPDFELFESDNRSFENQTLVYRGPDLATTVSGKPNGVYLYRIRLGDDGAYSNVHAVTVAHHSLGRAFTFLGIGAVVFFATLGLILGGNSRDETRTSKSTRPDATGGSDGQ